MRKGWTRVTLDLSPEMKAIAENLSERCGGSQAEMLRRAVALLKYVKDAQERGEKVATVKGGKVLAELVGF